MIIIMDRFSGIIIHWKINISLSIWYLQNCFRIRIIMDMIFLGSLNQIVTTFSIKFIRHLLSVSRSFNSDIKSIFLVSFLLINLLFSTSFQDFISFCNNRTCMNVY